jgi:hypothetical protein
VSLLRDEYHSRSKASASSTASVCAEPPDPGANPLCSNLLAASCIHGAVVVHPHVSKPISPRDCDKRKRTQLCKGATQRTWQASTVLIPTAACTALDADGCRGPLLTPPPLLLPPTMTPPPPPPLPPPPDRQRQQTQCKNVHTHTTLVEAR